MRPEAVLSLRTLRAWWHHRQGLDGHLAGRPAADVLARTGWARSVGGSAPYLTLYARAGIHRDEVDNAVAAQEICELPSARGCTYVLPAADFAVGLTCGASAPEAELAAVVKHLDVTWSEVDELCGAVLRTLEGAAGPLDPAALRRELGPAVRSLGEAGRKRGTTSTLPLALGLLQARGRIRRVPVNGRLDEQRFGYVPWVPSPLADAPDVEAAHTELARRYFRWAAPASLKQFRWFSGLGVGAAKAAAAPLHLVPSATCSCRPISSTSSTRSSRRTSRRTRWSAGSTASTCCTAASPGCSIPSTRSGPSLRPPGSARWATSPTRRAS